jgi:hypothetical protein
MGDIAPPPKLEKFFSPKKSFDFFFGNHKPIQEKKDEKTETPKTFDLSFFGKKKTEKTVRKKKENKPDKIKNNNILSVHLNIVKQLLEKRNKTDEMKKELDREKMIMQYTKNNYDLLISEKKVIKLEKEYEDSLYGYKFALYHIGVRDYITTDNDSHQKKSIQDWFGEEKVSSDENMKKKIFYHIASKFGDIEMEINRESENFCHCCQKENVMKKISDTNIVCEECGQEIDLLDETPSYRDSERVNLCRKYAYSPSGHFVNAILRYQGKQRNIIPKQIYDTIYKALQEKGYDSNKIMLVTKNMINTILLKEGKSQYYDHITLIHSTVTGIPPPDISEYESKLIEMNEQFDRYFEEKKAELFKSFNHSERKNSLNVSYKLYKFLQLIGYKCKRSDFSIVKGQSLILHDHVFFKICEELNWEIIQT